MAGTRVLIDSSILIDHLRKARKDATRFFRLSREYECCISSLTEFEFRAGMTAVNREYSEEIISNLLVIPFDSGCALAASEIFKDLKRHNRAIGVPDLMIAATAIRHQLPLCSLNRRHFERIARLKMVDS